jgi:hypothetical protein
MCMYIYIFICLCIFIYINMYISIHIAYVYVHVRAYAYQPPLMQPFVRPPLLLNRSYVHPFLPPHFFALSHRVFSLISICIISITSASYYLLTLSSLLSPIYTKHFCLPFTLSPLFIIFLFYFIIFFFDFLSRCVWHTHEHRGHLVSTHTRSILLKLRTFIHTSCTYYMHVQTCICTYTSRSYSIHRQTYIHAYIIYILIAYIIY